MNDATGWQIKNESRRTMLLRAAGGIAVIGAASLARPAQAAQVSQKSVNYQATPKGPAECDNYALFIAPAACKTVEGTISPGLVHDLHKEASLTRGPAHDDRHGNG
jgi:hypothetical protein